MSRKERLKIYHGIPKSVTDVNTLFYASFDGKIKPEIGGDLGIKGSFIQSPTGRGVLVDTPTVVTPTPIERTKALTIDCWLDSSKIGYVQNNFSILATVYSNGKRNMHIGGSESATDFFISFRSKDDTSYSCSFKSNLLLRGYNHLRNTVVISGSNSILLKQFLNGKLINEVVKYCSDDLTDFYFDSIYPLTGFNPSSVQQYLFKGFIADLHISNIDRGDYFPNIPQDFIDGKATIKARMGQQQIKGDPVYSQETIDIVKIGTNVNEPQITCSRTTGNWANGDTIKVKGLNDEIISGVIDSDTAICKITEIITNNSTLVKFKVDNPSALTVNDNVSVWNESMTYSWGGIYGIITEIDPTTSIISLKKSNNSNITITVGDRLFEITTTSSSPLVKTLDGTVIVGTWSSLGTNEVTFTLGTNSNLTTQDLYITYALNIKYGNSDFTEFPYSIEKVYDEVGNELQKVSEIVIEDDFKGKVPSSFEECPHFASFVASTTLQKPEQFSKDNYITYTELHNNDSYTTNLINKSNNGNISQLLVSFDLIALIERKFNSKILGNKIDWLKSNIKSVTLDSTVYGSGVGGNKINCTVYFSSTKSWNPASWNHSNSTPTLLNCVVNNDVNIQKIIGDDGRVNYLFYANATDTVTPSSIYLDYVCITIKLVDNTSFTTFFSKNKRAREMPCNPVLIQPETKTIKRYLPSNECFSTEYSYTKFDTIDLGSIPMDKTYENKLIYASTQGSGTYASSGAYKNCVNILKTKVNPWEYMNDTLYDSGFTQATPFATGLSDTHFSNNVFAMAKDVYKSPKYLNIKPYLRYDNNELKLLVYTGEITPNTINAFYPKQITKESMIVYKLPNRPLIK